MTRLGGFIALGRIKAPLDELADGLGLGRHGAAFDAPVVHTLGEVV